MELRNLIEQFLREMQVEGRSAWTVKNYGTALNKFAAWCEKNGIDFRTLTPRQAKHFRNYVASGGKAASTVNLAVSALSSFYDFLLEEGVVTGNPVISRRLRLKVPSSLPRFMDEDELKIVLDYVDRNMPSASMPFRTMLATGLRVSEVAGLTAGDVVVRGGRVMVRTTGKGNKDRYVPVTDQEVAKDLLELAEKRKTEDGRNARLFTLARGTLIAYAHDVKVATGVDFTSHRLRHTWATNLLAQGEPLDVVQELLGHSDPKTTRRYAATLPARWERLAARVV